MSKSNTVTAQTVAKLPQHGIDGLLPLSALHLSKSNVRKSKGRNEGIPELAALIDAQGLLQRLSVVEGDLEEGLYDVVAGGRRLEALQLLADQGKISPDEMIECKLYPDELAVQISMTENSGREEMHAADQYEAFRTMIEDEGADLDTVAARFGVSTMTVRRRLKLSQIAPQLLQEFRAGKISQEQLQVLALVDDQATQVHIWETVPSHQRSAYHLRSRVVAQEVPGCADVARFVGVDAYVAAGGAIRRDLFAEESGEGLYFCDHALLERLATEKLSAEAEKIKAEGWAWVSPRLKFEPYEERNFGRRNSARREPTKAEASHLDILQKRLETKQAELDALYDDDGEDDGEFDQRKVDGLEAEIDTLEASIQSIESGLDEFTPASRRKSGVVVTYDSTGGFRLVRGLVQPEDARAQRAAKSVQGEAGDEDGDDAGSLHMPMNAPTGKKARPDLPERMVLDLTAHRTAAMKAAMLQQPRVALVALVHRLCEEIFADFYNSSPLKISITDSTHAVSQGASGYDQSRAGKELAAAAAEWQALIPHLSWEGKSALFPWLMEQSDETLMRLLAYLTAQSLNVMTGTVERPHGVDDQLAAALGVDIADWWSAGVSTYFSHLPKAKAVEAVTQACDEATAQPLAKMKKDEAALAAEAAVHGKRWLPVPLRVIPPAQVDATPAE